MSLVIFTRIPRTGGTGFWLGVKDNFTEEECWQKGEYARKQYMAVGGLVEAMKMGKQFDMIPKVFMHHLPYGVHSLFPTDDYKYITFLRKPVSRIISLIRYTRDIKYDKEYEERLLREWFFKNCLFLQGYLRDMKDNDIIPVLEKCIKYETACNIMTKQISGVEDPANVLSTYARSRGNLYTINHTSTKYTRRQMEDFLAIAKANLQRYAFVGLQEQGNKDHKKACRVFDWRYKDVGRKNISIKRGEINWKGRKEQELLVRMNEYDIELYRYAKIFVLKKGIGTKYYIPSLDENSIVISGGGFVGDWDKYMLGRFNCRLFIFEPFPKSFKTLQKRFANKPKVTLIKKALLNFDGERNFYVFAGKDNAHSICERDDRKTANKIQVETIRLDTFMRENGITQVDLLKLNVEGSEIEILKSLDRKAARKIKCISFASHVGKIRTEEEHKAMIKHLQEIGYRVSPHISKDAKRLEMKGFLANRWKAIL